MTDELKQWEYDRGYEKGKADVLDKIRAEIDQIEINGHIRDVECFRAGINTALNIIDKYRTGSNETQTNEIVYDIGGHMYGAMGGDVIMDILAGKGKE